MDFDYGSDTSYPNLSESDEDDNRKQAGNGNRKRAGVDSPPIEDGLGQRSRTPGGPQQRPDDPLCHQLSQLHEKFVGITEGAFQRPIKAYLDQVDANEVGTRLKITSKRQTMTKKVNQVAEAVEAEGGLELKAVRVMI